MTEGQDIFCLLLFYCFVLRFLRLIFSELQNDFYFEVFPFLPRHGLFSHAFLLPLFSSLELIDRECPDLRRVKKKMQAFI